MSSVCHVNKAHEHFSVQNSFSQINTKTKQAQFPTDYIQEVINPWLAAHLICSKMLIPHSTITTVTAIFITSMVTTFQCQPGTNWGSKRSQVNVLTHLKSKGVLRRMATNGLLFLSSCFFWPHLWVRLATVKKTDDLWPCQQPVILAVSPVSS